MIRIIFSLLFLWVFSYPLSFGQAVPEAVHSKFKQRYPQSEVLEWENVGQKFKVAFFTHDNFYAEAIFRKNGRWDRTSKQISEAELPKEVLAQWKKEYPRIRSVSSINLVEKPGKKVEYHLSFETQELLVNLVFKKSGRLKKKIQEPISIDD